jgi:superfamily II DNA or RNA helicase
MKQKDRIYAIDKRIIIGTYNKAKEGMDIPYLDTEVLCTGRANVRQAVGRILRKEEYVLPPMVIDLVDMENEVYANRFNGRYQYYREHNFQIHEVEFYELPEKDQNSSRDYSAIDHMVSDIKKRSVQEIEQTQIEKHDPYANW